MNPLISCTRSRATVIPIWRHKVFNASQDRSIICNVKDTLYKREIAFEFTIGSFLDFNECMGVSTTNTCTTPSLSSFLKKIWNWSNQEVNFSNSNPGLRTNLKHDLTFKSYWSIWLALNIAVSMFAFWDLMLHGEWGKRP